MKPIHLIIQDELLRGCQIGALDIPMTRLSSEPGWQDRLCGLDEEIGTAFRPLVIVSIQVAGFIRRNTPNLARGVIADFEKCRFSRAMSLAPRGMALNDSYILLPFGEIAARREQIAMLFGDKIFLRPDDSRKSFSGFSLALDDLDFELSSLRQIQNVQDDELCVLDRHRDLRRSEYRTWLIEGQITTSARYSHYGHGPARDIPEGVMEMAGQLARQMELYHDAAVADFGIDKEGRPRLLEINAISTSGLYPGADIGAIVQAAGNLLV